MTVQHVPLGLIETPFYPRLAELSRARAWTGWAGYISPVVLDTVEFEYFAIRNQATLIDISPMHKYRVTGPDALHVMNRLVTRDREHDERVSCTDCRHYRPGRCGNHRRAGLHGAEVGRDLAGLLQRCPGFETVG